MTTTAPDPSLAPPPRPARTTGSAPTRPRTALRRLVADDTRLCGLSPRAGVLLLAGPPLAALALVATVLHRPLFESLTREDASLEWAQFLCFAVAAVAAAVAAGRLRRIDRLAALLFAGFAVAALFAAGEEISWGQRLFGWSTPGPLSAVNHQDETTLHNITGVQLAFNYLQLVGGLYGGVLAVVLRRRWRDRPLWAELALPVVLLAPAFLVMLGYRAARLTLLTEDRFVLVKLGEIPELCFAFALAAMAVLVARRARLSSWS